MDLKYDNNRAWTENIAIVSQLGLTMAGCIVFCFFVGRYIDKWLEIKGIFTVIFLLLGVAGGANVCYRQIMEVVEDEKKAKATDDNADTDTKDIS